MKERRNSWCVPVLALALALATACGGYPVNDSSTCAEAAEHVAACSGSQAPPVEQGCTPADAEALLALSCDQLASDLPDGKADLGGTLARAACAVGLYRFCEVPDCPTNVAAADADCQVCDAYDVLSEQLECSSEDYLVGFGARYCRRFALVTEPRVSAAGARWLTDVRRCLVDSLEGTNATGATCAGARAQGIGSHAVCYLESGVCDLPVSDWLAVLATIDPADFSFSQAIVTGNGCLAEWFGS